MAIGKNHFKNLFKKLNIKAESGGMSVNINMERIGRKFDNAQDAVDSEFLNRMLQHVPGEDGGALRADIQRFNETNGERGVVYSINPTAGGTPYGHYQLKRIMYADPKTGKGSFYTPEYGHWSRPGVEKVPTNRTLHYQNPNAVSDWGRYTKDNEFEDIVKAAKEGFKKE